MESEKVKEALSKEEIIEILKKRIENINPWETYALEYHKGLFNLINELESENERLKNRVAELENGIAKSMLGCEFLPECTNEKLKQFAERLKEVVSDLAFNIGTVGFDGYQSCSAVNPNSVIESIDETLKEFMRND